ncbi:LADA_0A00452g1_1 [Lachancea dasiensis]|uniref:LADA_0A00452g1_1 n=1 Tax=Lachancea dasiensis TaxID=1072105 RepID=A0A1G4IM49_9SACH|nr:LADA_0A00452g1_1 [Lachancea dasiensis]
MATDAQRAAETATKEGSVGKGKKIRINPLDVTRSLGYQTHRIKARKPWNKEEDELLRSCVNKHLLDMGYGNGIDSMKTIEQSNEICKNMPWDEIAARFDRKVRKPKDIRKRWMSSLDPNLRKGKWTSEEDELLMKSFAKWGSHWLKVSTEIPGRTEDQCAKRYIEVLDPSTKDRLRDWTLGEDLALISKVKHYGTSWRKISLEMESRPSLTCRNRWRKIITMIMRGKASEEITKAVQETSSGSSVQSLEELRQSLRIKLEDMKDDSPFSEELKVEEYALDPEEKSISNSRMSPNCSSPSNNSQSGDEHPSKAQWPTKDVEMGVQKLVKADGLDAPKSSMSNISIREEHSPEFTTRARAQNPPQAFHNLEENDPPRNGNELPTSIEAQGPHQPSPTHSTQGQKSSQQIHTDSGRPPAARIRSQSSKLDWNYALHDENGVPAAHGVISSSELVQELINQARKSSLTISIHQHIHNHYGTDASSALFQGDSINDDLCPDVRAHPFNGYRTQKPSHPRGFETDFPGRSPNLPGLALYPDPDLFAANQGPTFSYPAIAGYAHRAPINGTSIESRSTPGGEMEELPPHRQYHFNYLPPTVKPQLNSSDLAKTQEQSHSTNQSPNASHSRQKRRKRTKPFSSEGSTPNGPQGLTATTPRETGVSPQQLPHTKTETMSSGGRSSNLFEEEDLDFWESLRSLATVPSSNTRRSIQNDHTDKYAYLYNFYEDRRDSTYPSNQHTHRSSDRVDSANHNRGGQDGDRILSTYVTNPDLVHKGLPFNPS